VNRTVRTSPMAPNVPLADSSSVHSVRFRSLRFSIQPSFDRQTPRTYYDNRVNLIFKVGWSESATFTSGLIASG